MSVKQIPQTAALYLLKYHPAVFSPFQRTGFHKLYSRRYNHTPFETLMVSPRPSSLPVPGSHSLASPGAALPLYVNLTMKGRFICNTETKGNKTQHCEVLEFPTSHLLWPQTPFLHPFVVTSQITALTTLFTNQSQGSKPSFLKSWSRP